MPPYPGITSAMGLLTTDLKYDTTRTQFQVSGNVDLDRLNTDIAAMKLELGNSSPTIGWNSASVKFARGGDLRYVGQGYELKIPFPDGVITKAQLDDIFSRFHETHEREYGHVFSENPIEIVNVRVTGIGSLPKIEKLTAPKGTTSRKRRSRPANASFASMASCDPSKLSSIAAIFCRSAKRSKGQLSFYRKI